MRIEVYFHEMEEIIEATASVQLSNITFEKRGTHEGFIRGELHLIDGSTLHLREFVDVELTKDRFMYVYQYLDPRGKLVLRYDNTGHHKKLWLSTYPHHKHTLCELIDHLSEGERAKLLERAQKKHIKLSPFKKDKIDSILADFEATNLYEDKFLRDLKEGLKKSSVYR